MRSGGHPHGVFGMTFGHVGCGSGTYGLHLHVCEQLHWSWPATQCMFSRENGTKSLYEPYPCDVTDAREASDGDASVDENHVSNFNLSKEVCARLETKGITSLYSIQAQCFQPILDGKDLVGRARTGCGKTLAFVLPIVEVINRENPMPASGRRVQGRRPVVALLAPTRELAKQVQEHGLHRDFF